MRISDLLNAPSGGEAFRGENAKIQFFFIHKHSCIGWIWCCYVEYCSTSIDILKLRSIVGLKKKKKCSSFLFGDLCVYIVLLFLQKTRIFGVFSYFFRKKSTKSGQKNGKLRKNTYKSVSRPQIERGIDLSGFRGDPNKTTFYCKHAILQKEHVFWCKKTFVRKKAQKNV